MGRAVNGPGQEPAHRRPSPVLAASSARAGLSPGAAAAALGLPRDGLGGGEPALAPESEAAVGLIRLYADAEDPVEVPRAVRRLVGLAAQGRVEPAVLRQAIEADPSVAAGVIARAAAVAAAGGGRRREGEAEDHPVTRAVALLGRWEAVQLAALLAVRPLTACPFACRVTEQAALWPERFRAAAVTARLAGALGVGSRLDPAGEGRVAGQAFAAGLLGALASAGALRALAALRQEGTFPALSPHAARQLVRAAQPALAARVQRRWSAEERFPGAGASLAAWWRPVPWLVRLAGALDDLATGPGADPGAASEAVEAASHLGFSPAALAAAEARRLEAAAWFDRACSAA